MGQASRAKGRGLTFTFVRGGHDNSRLMNLINLPMEGSAVVRKMKGKDSNGESGDAQAKSQANGKAPNLSLMVKKELAAVETLGIRLKPSELRKLGDASATAPGDQDGNSEGHDVADTAAAAAAQSGVADAAEDEPPAKKAKLGKIERKRLQFRPYDSERKVFSTMAQALNGTDSRPITALDDLVAALNFVTQLLVDQKIIKSKEDECALTAFSFCASIWFEFAWHGKAVLNGGDFRQHSALRSELQQAMIDASERLQAPQLDGKPEGHGSLGSGGDSNRKQAAKSMNPLELAETWTSPSQVSFGTLKTRTSVPSRTFVK